MSGSAIAPWRAARYKILSCRVVLLVLLAGTCCGRGDELSPTAGSPGLSYTNNRVTSVPWSIHVVRWDRANRLCELHSVHAGGKAVGLDTLSQQVTVLSPALGTPVAAINGDFYQRDNAFAGAPRGLQIVNGELISAPSGGVTFWTDAVFQTHTTNVSSMFRIGWPDGSTSAFGLNGERRADGVELYSPALGTSTQTAGGRELVLERADTTRWLPLRIGQDYTARVREIHDGGNTPLSQDTLVLSIGPAALAKIPQLQQGSVLRISTQSFPALHGVRTAISGGPVLLRAGKRQKLDPSGSEAYEFSSMLERHPRTAIGWNAQAFLLVEVDGRQKHLSVGMTLDELSDYLLGLGCTDAMNLDGGGSATLWYEGEVKNSPCDRMEREIANCLVVVRKRSRSGTPDAPNTR